MTQKVNISDDTYREVENLLAKNGKQMDVEAYVNRTLSRDLFFETVREIRSQTKDVDPDELETIIDEAVEAVRAERRKQSPSADCN